MFTVWVLFIALLWIFRPRDLRMSEAVRIVPDLLRMVRSLIAGGSTPLGVRLAQVGLVAWLLTSTGMIRSIPWVDE